MGRQYYFSSGLASSSLISLGNIPAKFSSSSSSFLPLLRVEAKERASFRYFLMGQFFESTSGSVILPFAEQDRQDLPCLTSKVCSCDPGKELYQISTSINLTAVPCTYRIFMLVGNHYVQMLEGCSIMQSA